jgi:hypothetical protein
MTLTGDDYRYRFEVDAKQRFIDSLRERFNAGVTYKGRVLKWDTVIEQKAKELSRFLIHRSQEIDFTQPFPVLVRVDSRSLRTKIMSLTERNVRKMGIGKSTLHYLRRRAQGEMPFRVYGSVSAKLPEMK